MCQQTRVQTVIDYWTRWLKRWPTVEDLAKATSEEVNEAWAGLGYYRRAKYLHQGAQKVVSDLGGKLPRTAAALEKIPGIGKYTAGAIASVAFGEAAPLVDGNVIRVLSRLRALGLDPKSSTAVKLHWELAGKLVPSDRPGAFNQALMELGAILCTVQSPSCSSCPVNAHCRAYAEATSRKESSTVKNPFTLAARSKAKKTAERRAVDSAVTGSCDICGDLEDFGADDFSVTRYPRKVKKTQRDERVSVCIVEHRAAGSEPKFLLVQRPAEGLLAGFWELPQGITGAGAAAGKDGGDPDDADDDDDEPERPRKKARKAPTKKRSTADEEDDAEDAPVAARRKADKAQHAQTVDDYLSTVLGFVPSTVESRRRLGETVHLFSHIRQTIDVEHLIVRDFRVDAPKSAPPTRWLTEAEVMAAAISKSTKTCLSMRTTPGSKPPASKKPAVASSAKKATSASTAKKATPASSSKKATPASSSASSAKKATPASSAKHATPASSRKDTKPEVTSSSTSEEEEPEPRPSDSASLEASATAPRLPATAPREPALSKRPRSAVPKLEPSSAGEVIKLDDD
eukprot:TRINITY_DN878_c0_g4_i1.p1 TRINITY_DN878_c0_g4~~TRINITY_DN878_c0_g4_i1.p1  ORF type:complete len:633 (-),score=132.66 TRINITY_DN878_c0_g4_i1:400-2115(-)